MIEEIHQFFYEIFDWCFPELLYWEVSEYSEERIRMVFVTDYKEFQISIKAEDWLNRDEKKMHFKKIKLIHRILNDNQPLQPQSNC